MARGIVQTRPLELVPAPAGGGGVATGSLRVAGARRGKEEVVELPKLSCSP